MSMCMAFIQLQYSIPAISVDSRWYELLAWSLNAENVGGMLVLHVS